MKRGGSVTKREWYLMTHGRNLTTRGLSVTRGDANMVCIDKSAHVHHKDFGMRTETLYKGWAGRTKTVRKGFVGPVPQNVTCKGSIGPTKAAYKV